MITYTNEVYLVWFLPLCLLAYQLCPRRHRGKVLIGASYVFFFIISKWLLLYLAGLSILTHYLAIGIEMSRQKGRKGKVFWWIALLVPLGILFVWKYGNFVVQNLTKLVNQAGDRSVVISYPAVALPIGISFYTLEAVGYVCDVWWGRIKASRKLENTILFLCFFPKLMEGPICRWQDVEATMFSHENLKLDNLETGAIRIFWGLLKKIVVADRLAIVVDALYKNYASYEGLVIVLAAILYTAQLYMEFSGVMDIVIGSARLFGIRLPENFRQPFFAKNASEFWKRWHISLGVWFKNYIFYPMSTSGLVKKWNKFGRKKLGKGFTRAMTSALCLFPVWMANGVWHGARWSYIFYGMYYFVIVLAETITEPAWKKGMEKIHVNMNAPWYRFLQMLKLLAIVFTGEMFFRANGFRDGLAMFTRIFRGSGIQLLKDHLLLNLGIDKYDWIVAILGIIVVAVADILKEKGLLSLDKLKTARMPIRWSAYYALIIFVIIFGAYGDGYKAIDLIYAGF